MNHDDTFKNYTSYLSKRKLSAVLYRNFYLYPRLSLNLKGKVLDVGCGIGDFLKFRKNTVGLELNPHNVHYCKSQGLNCHQLDGERYPFEDNSFDGVIMDNVLEHISDPGPVLSELHRVLRTSGILIIGVPGKVGYDTDPDHKVFYDEDMLRNLKAEYFQFEKIIHTPLKLKRCERMRQYCLYAIYKNR